jgi:hypothetical protein
MIVLPDKDTTVEQLADIVKKHGLQELLGPNTKHNERVQLVRGALLDRFNRGRVVSVTTGNAA